MAERSRACALLTVRGFDACVDSRLNKTDEYRERYTTVRQVYCSINFEVDDLLVLSLKDCLR